MPVFLSVKADVRAVQRQLADIGKQMPRAIARAINDTAQQAAKDVNAALPRRFHHVTPFTRNAAAAPAALKATPDGLTAVVLIKDKQARYLLLEETGGTRTPARRGIVVPGKGARLNAYANLPNKYVAKLAELADQKVSAQRGGKRRGDVASVRRNRGVFRLRNAGIGGRGPGGFFRRMPDGHVVRLITFEDATHYRPKFGFQQLVRDSVARNFRSNLDRTIRFRLAKAGR